MTKETEILSLLHKEIDSNGNKEQISHYENLISNDIEKFIEFEELFSLPLKNLFEIVEKIDLTAISDFVLIIKNLIQKIVKAHNSEEETLLLLKKINCSNLTLTLEDCISIIGSISNCQICNRMATLFVDSNKDIDFDYEYELKQKEKEIQNLKDEGVLPFLLDSNVKPNPLETDLFKAISKGDANSVQYLLQNSLADKEMRDNLGNTPLLWAVWQGKFVIVLLLVQRFHVDIQAVNKSGKNPYQLAVTFGYTDIANFLKSKMDSK